MHSVLSICSIYAPRSESSKVYESIDLVRGTDISLLFVIVNYVM